MGDPHPIEVDVAYLVVEGAQGQPVVVACDQGNGEIVAETAKPETLEEFNRILEVLGVGKVTYAENIDGLMIDPSQPHRLPKIMGK